MYSLLRPVVREAELVNTSSTDLLVEFKFCSPYIGVELTVERSNPNTVYKDCRWFCCHSYFLIDIFSEKPIYRYAKRPNDLYSQLYRVHEVGIQKNKSRKFLFLLTVSPSFFSSPSLSTV